MVATLSPSVPKKRFSINFVLLQGGGGHYATYHALRSIIEKQGLPWDLSVTDMDEIAQDLAQQNKILDVYKLFGTSATESYVWIQKSGLTWLQWLTIRLWKFLIKLNYDVGVKVLESHWREQQPDMVVIAAPYYTKLLCSSLQSAKPDTPVVSVITDFADYPPAFWFEPKLGSYAICGTQKLVEQARSMGVKDELIIESSGMVIHPHFYEPINCERRSERQKLGLDPDCFTGLVLFGANGSKVMLEIASLLECFKEKLQLIFICGHNKELALALRESQGIQNRFVTTFTQDIPYYMHLADFFIGKPGACSISEALVMKLPVILERNIATLPQERYNTCWVEEKQVGLVLRSFRNIHAGVGQFLQPENFAQYRKNIDALNNQAVFEIPNIMQKILATSYKTEVAETLSQR